MARFLVLWRTSPTAPFPTDPVESAKFTEQTYASIDDLMNKGEIEEFGFFPDGSSGYAICIGEAADMFRMSNMFLPYWPSEVHEIIPYEKGKEISIALSKAQIEAAKK